MTRTQQLFEECINTTPEDVKLRVDLSFQIADKIVAILQQRGMTQKEFAHKIGHSEAEVSRWVGGTHNFTIATLAKISSTLGVPIISV